MAENRKNLLRKALILKTELHKRLNSFHSHEDCQNMSKPSQRFMYMVRLDQVEQYINDLKSM